jgi:uncharacterized protein (TIGR02271 family)
MSQTVVGIFEHANQAQEAKAYLIANGFNSENIDINTIAGSNYGDNPAAETDEGLGDRIGHFFSHLFDDESDAKSHSDAARRGTTVTVYTTTEDQTMQAVQVLDNFGAVDVNDFAQSARSTGASTGTMSSPGTIGTAGSLDTSSMGYNAGAEDTLNTDNDIDTGVGRNNDAIPIIEEDLQVGKQEIQTGGVRMRSRIVERPVQESIRLRTEHVNVERTPVDRPATSADFAGFQEGTVEVTEHAEIPVVEKDARVVEEVSLNKEVTENEQTISDTVRRTEVDTENLNDKKNNI